MPVIDIHPHIVSPDTQRYPLAPLGGTQSTWSSERPTTYQTLIKAMDEALEGAVATLPHPVSSTRVRNIAESILRSAKQGESNPRTLQTMALVEMQIRSGEQ